MEIVKTRPLGNRKSMTVGGLVFRVREGVGRVKMAPEFYLAPSNVQLNLLDDWINELEAMYNAEIEEAGTLNRKARPTKKALRTYDES